MATASRGSGPRNLPPLITSADNPTVKRIRSLADRRHRRAESAAVVHGIQPVRQAAEAGFAIDTLVVAPDLLRSESAISFVAAQQDVGVRVTRLSADLFTRLSDREHPSGLAAIVRTRDLGPGDLTSGPAAAFVALHRLGNPGNLGTIVRTADAAGADGVLLVGPTADQWDPKAVKASMGAIFSTPVVRLPDEAALFDWAHQEDLRVITTAARAARQMWEISFPSRHVLLLGAEGDGLDDQTLAHGDLQVSIPMTGTAESLNVAVAAGVLLYEAARQRRADAAPGAACRAGGPAS